MLLLPTVEKILTLMLLLPKVGKILAHMVGIVAPVT